MTKLNTLPDDLTQISPQAIKACYGYLLSDKRWVKGLQRAEFALKMEGIFSERARENQAKYHGNQYDSGLKVKSPEVQESPIETKKELAKIAGVGEQTIQRAKKIEAKADEKTSVLVEYID